MKAIVVCLLLAVPVVYVLHVQSAFRDTIDKARSAQPMPPPTQPMQLDTQPLQINGPTPLCIDGIASGAKTTSCPNARPVPPMANESLRHR